ncbi:MAG: hypothetical protein ACR2NG_08925 [Acidimicrobiia bacterium]
MTIKVGVGLLVVGFLVQMFSGYTYTVESPAECPPDWEGDRVISTEVYDGDGNVDGYWCLVEGSITQTGSQTYHNIPVGNRAGYAQWYGFAIMLAGLALVGIGLIRGRMTASDVEPSDPAEAG